MSELTDYERERQERIARNKALLASLDIPKALSSYVKPIINEDPASTKKRKRQSLKPERANAQSHERAPMTRRVSARLQNMVSLYSKHFDTKKMRKYVDSDDEDLADNSASEHSSEDKSFEEKRKPQNPSLKHLGYHLSENGIGRRTVNGRNVAHIDRSFERPDPKTFGDIPGVLNGQWWATRMECSRDGCHAPTVAGISGNEKDGCWSIALSGGYEDDVDEGYCFTYTGSGGRDLKGTKAKPKNLRTAPQSSDQTLTGLNLAVKVSCDNGKPVRVIRGFKGASKWAPLEGYR